MTVAVLLTAPVLLAISGFVVSILANGFTAFVRKITRRRREPMLSVTYVDSKGTRHVFRNLQSDDLAAIEQQIRAAESAEGVAAPQAIPLEETT